MNCKYCNSYSFTNVGWIVQRNNKRARMQCNNCSKVSYVCYGTKASYVVIETIDERGRFITDNEFWFIMDYFKDRYDPRRLSFALAYTTGLRYLDASQAMFTWFDEDITFMKMGECKPTKSIKDDVITYRKHSKNVPLPEWLTEDLLNFRAYRLMIGQYVGEDITKARLFPKLNNHSMRDLFGKLRMRYGKTQKWLMDVWQIEKAYDENNNLIYERPFYRVACHAARANYVTACHYVAKGDYLKGKALSGHSDVRSYAVYVRHLDLRQKREEIKDSKI